MTFFNEQTMLILLGLIVAGVVVFFVMKKEKKYDDEQCVGDCIRGSGASLEGEYDGSGTQQSIAGAFHYNDTKTLKEDPAQKQTDKDLFYSKINEQTAGYKTKKSKRNPYAASTKNVYGAHAAMQLSEQ